MDETLTAIIVALLQTRRHIEQSDGVKCFDRGQEYELARLWKEASVRARHVKKELG